MITLSVVTQKGGAGKTATAAALAAGLSRNGLKVLAIDIDPQRNLSAQLGCGRGNTIYNVLVEKLPTSKAIQITAQGHVLQSDHRLAEKGVLSGKYSEFSLKNALEPIQRLYDVAVIDCPPNIGSLTVAALAASNTAIIPAVPDRHSVESVGQTLGSIAALRQATNRDLTIMGILPTMYQKRFTVHKVMLAQLQKLATGNGIHLFKPIRYCSVVQEVEFTNHSVFDGRKGNPAAEDYSIFVDDVLKQLERMR